MSSAWKPAITELDTPGGVRGPSGEGPGLKAAEVTPETLAVMGRLALPPHPPQPVVPPIYHTSTYRVNSAQEYLDILQDGGYIYSRLCNPSTEQVECVVKALEGGAGSLAFSSGMSAVSTAISGILRPGDHVVAQNPIYSGTHKYLSKYCPENGIEYTWVEAGCAVEDFKKAVKPNTKMLIGETPCNPRMTVLDLEKFGKLGQEMGVVTMVDSTFASPFLQQPIKYGVDIVVQSGTKYLGGHSDLVAGLLTTRTEEMWTKFNLYRTTLGNVLSPFDASLLTRGMKTLHVRMERHCFNAQRIAEYLDSHQLIEAVFYPGLTSHPGHLVAKRQMKMFGGMVSFEMKGGFGPAKTVIENVRVIQLAVSLGGVESLMSHPASMTHGPMIMTDAEREESMITPGLIRFSVGLENIEDLIKDLEQALEKV